MTVMLLQRFGGPQSTYSNYKLENKGILNGQYCNYYNKDKDLNVIDENAITHSSTSNIINIKNNIYNNNNNNLIKLINKNSDNENENLKNATNAIKSERYNLINYNYKNIIKKVEGEGAEEFEDNLLASASGIKVKSGTCSCCCSDNNKSVNKRQETVIISCGSIVKKRGSVSNIGIGLGSTPAAIATTGSTLTNNNININENNNNNLNQNSNLNLNNSGIICDFGGSGGGGGGGRGGGGGGGGVVVGTINIVGSFSASGSQTRFCGQGVAMRYYRLWIYACNIVLFGSALGFAAAVSRTLLFSGDPRRYLIPGVPRGYDLTSLYAYLALTAQLGLVQLLGCIAARKLSAKLLHAYWILLLALLFGDAIIGVAWVFKFEKMRSELRPMLRLRLQKDYLSDIVFTEQWDQLQKDYHCCGITGPNDFDTKYIPDTCCPLSQIITFNPLTTTTNLAVNSNSSSISNDTNSNSNSKINTSNNKNNNNNISVSCQQPFNIGCEEILMNWLRKTADLLFVLGFCVIAFAKLCFLGILRYEIREMIQKIQLLRDPPPPASSTFIQSLCPNVQQTLPTSCINNTTTSTISATGLSSIPTNFNINTNIITGNNNTNNNNNIITTTCNSTLMSPPAAAAAAATSTATSTTATLPGNHNIQLLQASQDYGNKHSILYQQQDNGADSDTNSHCALILEESTPTPPSNRNCNLTREKNNNGNNNYEMREFNRRYLLSNGGNPTIIEQNKKT